MLVAFPLINPRTAPCPVAQMAMSAASFVMRITRSHVHEAGALRDLRTQTSMYAPCLEPGCLMATCLTAQRVVVKPSFPWTWCTSLGIAAISRPKMKSLKPSLRWSNPLHTWTVAPWLTNATSRTSKSSVDQLEAVCQGPALESIVGAWTTLRRMYRVGFWRKWKKLVPRGKGAMRRRPTRHSSASIWNLKSIMSQEWRARMRSLSRKPRWKKRRRSWCLWLGTAQWRLWVSVMSHWKLLKRWCHMESLNWCVKRAMWLAMIHTTALPVVQGRGTMQSQMIVSSVQRVDTKTNRLRRSVWHAPLEHQQHQREPKTAHCVKVREKNKISSQHFSKEVWYFRTCTTKKSDNDEFCLTG